MWKLEAGERIARWRAFRIEIGGMPLERAIQYTAEFWQNCPHSPYYLDPNDPESWPTAWDLITENYYCDLAKCLGMLYTLYLSNHRTDMEIRIYNDPSTTDLYNLVWIDKGKYVVNYVHDEVVNKTQLDQALKLKKFNFYL